MKTNYILKWSQSKVYMDGDKKKRICVVVSLSDECHNKVCDFSITGIIEEQKKNGRRVLDKSGCIHEEIVKAFPELEKFIHLHCCNYLGQPTYLVRNGQYYSRCSEKKSAMDYLRCTEQEYELLKLYSDDEEGLYFKYLLFHLGIVER